MSLIHVYMYSMILNQLLKIYDINVLKHVYISMIYAWMHINFIITACLGLYMENRGEKLEWKQNAA